MGVRPAAAISGSEAGDRAAMEHVYIHLYTHLYTHQLTLEHFFFRHNHLVSGILKGYDQLMNLVLDQGVELFRGECRGES